MATVDERMEELAEKLDAQVFAEEFDDLPYPTPDNQITALTDQDVNRVLRRMAAEQHEVTRIEDQARDEIERIQARRDELTEGHTKRLVYLQTLYGPMIEEYTRQALEGKRERSLDYIHGVTGFRKHPASVEITDEAACEEWAKANCAAAIKISTSLLKTPIKAHIEETGECVPGVELVPGEDRFYLKVK